MESKWTNEFLGEMREIVDPLADKVIARLIEAHGVDTFNAMMKDLVNNRDVIPASLPPVVREYFEETQALPAWVDQQMLVRGEEIFALYGLEMVSMLSLVSLPNSYALQKGVNVLAITAQLTKRVHRRIFRTAQFILDVMQPGGLGPNGNGIRSVQKVRLIHAAIRYRIAHFPRWKAQWNPAWGQPINQEDMAETLLDFSVTVLRGVRKIGVKLTAEEAEAYHYAWRVVGHILGVRPELLPENVQEAFELADAIRARSYGESAAGKELTKDLIQFQQGFMPSMLRGFPATAIRYLSGNEVANLIKSGPYNWTLLFLYIQIGVMGLLVKFQNIPGLQKYVRFLTWNLIHKTVLREEGGEFYFEIPDSLRVRWRMPARSMKARAK